MNNLKKKFLKELKKLNNIYHSQIPDKYKDDLDVKLIERKKGMRKIEKIGFDVIKQQYFVYEECKGYTETYTDKTYFNSFDEYYNYVEGKIYNKSCYYQCTFDNTRKKIDKNKALKRKCFIDESIKNYEKKNKKYIKDLINKYQKNEVKKREIRKWVKTINKSNSYSELNKKINSFRGGDETVKELFLWEYIKNSLNNETKINVAIEYIAKKDLLPIAYGLCNVYDGEKVLSKFKDFYKMDLSNSQGRIYRKCSHIKEYIDSLKDNKKHKYSIVFDENTHYYNIEYNRWMNLYFYDFKDLINYLDYDLRNADLSNNIDLNYDLTKCKTDSTTKLPMRLDKKITYIIKKEYKDDKFVVTQEWFDINGNLINSYENEFDFFFDFIAFLDYDLSNADLTMCEGLSNLNNISKLNFENAKVLSDACDKFGINYSRIKNKEYENNYFEIINTNEKSNNLQIKSIRSNDDEEKHDKVYYITDIHIDHKIKLANVKSEIDKEFVITNIVKSIINDINIDYHCYSLKMIFGGDVSYDYEVFKLFVTILRQEIDKKFEMIKKTIVFTLGNHELWGFSNVSFEKIVKKYRQLLMKNGMYLIQNDMLYVSEGEIKLISEKSLKEITKEKLRKVLEKSWFVIFGGIGFSGYNIDFNANNGIYRNTISREEEIKESKLIESLYNKITDYIPDKSVIICTHMPITCWSNNVEYQNGYIYVSGHTHRNFFTDDMETRIYEDNQIGYFNKSVHLKYFYINNTYDYFYNYKDGIHTITSNDYKEFYYGKHKPLTFNREYKELYMLKKDDIYCFILKNYNDNLNILNAGSLKKLKNKNINYYYNNMEHEINQLKKLEPYNEYLKKISHEIKKIGGVGRYHGCIVDINFYNHLFVGPQNIIPYYAEDIKYKKVYPSILSLLKDNCPEIYNKYLNGVKNNELMILQESIIENNSQPEVNLETDMYTYSRKILKGQKIKDGILAIWPEEDKTIHIDNGEHNRINNKEKINKLIEQKD